MKKLHGKGNFGSVTAFKLGTHLSVVGCYIFK